MAFDVKGARSAGYSDDEIAGFLAERSGFDVAGARHAGYSSAEILGFLTQEKPSAAPSGAHITDAEIDSLSMAQAAQDAAAGKVTDTPKPSSVLEGRYMPEPEFDPAEGLRLSRRAAAEREMTEGDPRLTAPSMRQGARPQPASRGTEIGRALQDSSLPVRAAAKAYAGAAEGAGGLVRAVGDVTGIDPLSAAGAATASGARDVQTGMGEIGQVEGFGPKSPVPYLASMAEGAASSLGQSVATGAALGPGAVIPALSLMTAGQEYDKARQAGMDPAAALAGAVPKGVFEAVGEKFQGLDKAMGAMGILLTKGVSAEAKRTAADVLVQAGIREIPGEVITYLGQSGIDKLPGIGLNPNMTMADFINGLRDTVVQAGMMGGAMGGVGVVAGGRAPQAQRKPETPDSLKLPITSPIDAIATARTTDEAIAAAAQALDAVPVQVPQSVEAVQNIERILGDAGAATDETPTAMQLAMQRAMARKTENANVSPTAGIQRVDTGTIGGGVDISPTSLGDGVRADGTRGRPMDERGEASVLPAADIPQPSGPGLDALRGENAALRSQAIQALQSQQGTVAQVEPERAVRGDVPGTPQLPAAGPAALEAGRIASDQDVARQLSDAGLELDDGVSLRKWSAKVGGLGDVLVDITSQPGDPVRATVRAQYMGKDYAHAEADGMPAILANVQKMRDGIQEFRQREAQKMMAGNGLASEQASNARQVAMASERSKMEAQRAKRSAAAKEAAKPMETPPAGQLRPAVDYGGGREFVAVRNGNGKFQAVDPSGNIIPGSPEFNTGPEADYWRRKNIAAQSVQEAAATTDRRQEPRGADRRTAIDLRKRVADMSEPELRDALLTDHLTGLKNRRAYDESAKLPVQVSIDADSLKWVNDTLGHDSGDQLLKAIGQALGEETQEAYHVSGDEFVVQANTEAEARAIMERARMRMSQARIEATDAQGKDIVLTGVGVSYGIAGDLNEAEKFLGRDKAQRESQGLRAARGEVPPNAAVRGRGEEDQARGAAAEEVDQAGKKKIAPTPDTPKQQQQGRPTGGMQERPAVRAVSGSLEEPTQSDGGAGSGVNATTTAKATQAALKAANEALKEQAEFDVQKELKDIAMNGNGADVSDLLADPKYWNAEDEEMTPAGQEEEDRRNQALAEERAGFGPIDELSDLNKEDQTAQAEAFNAYADALGLNTRLSYSSGGSRYVEVDIGEQEFKFRFADHFNTVRDTTMQPDFNVAPGRNDFTEAVDFLLGKIKESTPAEKPISQLSAADLLRAAADKMEGRESKPAQETAKAVTSDGAEKIEDFGEKLPPARRKMAAKLDEALSDDKIATLPFSQVWPASENDAIEDTFAAAVAHAARAEVPAKPRVAYKVKSWVEKVKTVRNLASMIVSGKVTREKFMERAQEYSLKNFVSKVKLLEQLDRADWKRIGAVSEAPDAYQYGKDGTKVAKPMVSVTIDGRHQWIEGSGDILQHVDAIKAMLNKDAPESRMQFEIRRDRAGKFLINKKGDKETRTLLDFDTVEESRAAIKDRYADLLAAWEGVKDRDNISERDLRTAENRPRTGKDHRGGNDITAEEFQERFGFRGGEFGKWVSQGTGKQERQALLNSAYDALMDLSDLLGIPPKAVSLDGSLGMAFGSRGGGWASAHFEPSNLVINLTKPRGAGALAHEWFHALDNYFARQRGGEVAFTGNQDQYRRDNFVTYKTTPMMVRKDGRGTPVTKERLAEWRKGNHGQGYLAADQWIEDPKHKTGVRAEVEQRFDDLVKALNASPMLKRARALDGVKEAEGYWSQVIERAARSFENYVQTRMMEQGYHNDFLANVKAAEDVGKNKNRYPYLLPDEIAPIAEAFDNLFQTIETKDTDKGVAMFSRGEGQLPAVINPSTVSRVQSAIAELLGGKQLPNSLGRIVTTTADEIKSTWEPLIGKKKIGSEGEAGVAMAFYEPGTKTVFMIADHINVGTETAVLAHELMHKHGQTVLGKAGWDRLHGVISTWKDAKEGTDERRVYDDASAKVEAAGAELSNQELFPYAVEAAIKLGIKPSMAAKRGTVASWLESVRQNLKMVWGKITGNPATFKTQDLVDLAFGIAQMENSDTLRGALDETSPEQKALQALSENDELFALPKSDKTTVEEIAAETDPKITIKTTEQPGLVQTYVLTMPDGAKAKLMVRKVNPYGPQAYGMLERDDVDLEAITERPGENAQDVPDNTEDVYIDVSSLKEGGYGSMVYNIAATYAHNTGRILIGDPAGLSDDAMRRRTENMLSSALKFGTTRHLAPHPRQTMGARDIGVPPMRWTYGDDLGNIQELIRVSNQSLDYAGGNPFTFDASTGTFRDSEGGAIDDDAISLAVEAGAGRSQNAGVSTLKRNAVLGALVREKGKQGSSRGAGAGVLAQLVDVGRQHAASTQGIFYSRRVIVGQTNRSAWKDQGGRAVFAPGQALYNLIGKAANPLLVKLQMKAASPELRRQLRAMKLDVQKAQDVAVAVAHESQKLSNAERLMVSGIIEKELKSGIIPPEHAIRLAAVMNEAMHRQSDELVRLGMLSPETAKEWDGRYLPRFYESKLKKQVGDAWADAARLIGLRPKSMKGIKGQHLKGRGLYETIPESQLASYEAMGWKVRDPDYTQNLPSVDGTVQVWRDFTRQERDSMGEIRDAGFRFVMGYMQTQRDIALGRMFEGMASNPETSSRLPRDGWVRVPDTTVEGTGAKRYGKLAGRYVPAETLSQLTNIEEAQSSAWRMYRGAMAVWKSGKTALNPVSHTNNIVSNLTMAHFAGIGYHRADKYIGALRDFVKSAPMVKEARDAGLFLGTMSDAELMNTMPAELKALAVQADSKLKKGATFVFDAMTFWLRKPMGAAYQAEDTFFRYLIYRDARQRGVDPQDAVDYAQKYIFTYDDLPKGARYIRDFGIPFFAYTYKAVPALLNTALTRPDRFAAPAAVLWAANAAAYAIATGDDDDDWMESIKRYLTDSEYRAQVREKEKLERELLPPWMKGHTALFTPKAIRLGMDEMTKLPVFLDTSRIVPGGDIFDVNPNAGGIPLPQPITPSHPLFSIATAMIANKDLYFGKELVDSNDTRAEAVAKRGAWIWKQMAPAIAVGNYHWERGMNAIAQASGGEVKWVPDILGGDATGISRDGNPVQAGYAVMQTFGIKARPIDLETSELIDHNMRRAMIRNIDAELRKMQRLNIKGVISDRVYDAEFEKAQEKKDRLREGLTVDGDERK